MGLLESQASLSEDEEEGSDGTASGEEDSPG